MGPRLWLLLSWRAKRTRQFYTLLKGCSGLQSRGVLSLLFSPPISHASPLVWIRLNLIYFQSQGPEDNMLNTCIKKSTNSPCMHYNHADMMELSVSPPCLVVGTSLLPVQHLCWAAAAAAAVLFSECLIVCICNPRVRLSFHQCVVRRTGIAQESQSAALCRFCCYGDGSGDMGTGVLHLYTWGHVKSVCPNRKRSNDSRGRVVSPAAPLPPRHPSFP